VYTNEEIWTIFSSAVIDLTGARIRENFKWRIFKLPCLSFEYPKLGSSIIKLSILFSIWDNAVLARLEKYSVSSFPFFRFGVPSITGDREPKISLEVSPYDNYSFPGNFRCNYETSLWAFNRAGLVIPSFLSFLLPACNSHTRAYAWIYENNYYRSKEQKGVLNATIPAKPRADR